MAPPNVRELIRRYEALSASSITTLLELRAQIARERMRLTSSTPMDTSTTSSGTRTSVETESSPGLLPMNASTVMSGTQPVPREVVAEYIRLLNFSKDLHASNRALRRKKREAEYRARELAAESGRLEDEVEQSRSEVMGIARQLAAQMAIRGVGAEHIDEDGDASGGVIEDAQRA